MYEKYHDIIKELCEKSTDSDKLMDMLIRNIVNTPFNYKREPYYTIINDHIIITISFSSKNLKPFLRSFPGVPTYNSTYIDAFVDIRLIDILSYLKQDNIEKSILEMI